MPDVTSTNFLSAVSFVNARAGTDLQITDDAKLDLYALFKQATAGDAQDKDRPNIFGGVVKRAKWDAWKQHKGMARNAAKDEYVSLVQGFGAGFEPEGRVLRRRRSSVSMSSVRSFGSLNNLSTAAASKEKQQVPPDYSKLDREALVKELELLQSEVAKLSVFRVYKEGKLSRCRETMTGEDWTVRYYEVKPGFLRCYKSYEERILRLEVPLHKGATVVVEPNYAGTATGAGRYKHFVVLTLPRTDSKRSNLTQIKLGSDSVDDANEWSEAILLAAEDGGEPPKQEKVEKGKRKFDPSLRDFHKKHQASYLSSDQTDRQSYRGFANLILVVAMVGCLRNIVDNVSKYGNFLTQALKFSLTLESNDYIIVAASALLPFFIVSTYLIEKVGTTTWASVSATKFIQFVNVSASLLVPCYLSHSTQANPAVCGPLIFLATVMFLKLVSYAHTNAVLRERWLTMPPREGPPNPTSYPDNVSLFDIVRFMAFPTLCYQTNYPRTPFVRKKWLAKRLIELLITLFIQVVVFQQFMMPVLLQSAQAKNSEDPMTITKYTLTLAIPSLLVWLCMFYALFHLWLNILAEATCFGDRQFYKAWWNATKLDVYWRDWNIPVHAWLVRHLFMPCMNAGLGKSVSMFIVFFVSAVFHEVLVSVPCHTSNWYAFAGMMGQVPLIALTNVIEKRFKESQVGNFIFWLSFCIVGQPLCILLYFIEVAGKNSGSFRV
ncbi:hypothetical protein TrLO_g1570 [Triparma laevis f. longispina]|uniref:diacylglycerol O-acyltransferase n=1 Tax=Triparma laevis f. longispina TaxID=1714387 RepID=A0A9W7A0S5_9STRA|nr:hypothetical protein TrLO_g1570 [Triparma laevis f. longispina]